MPEDVAELAGIEPNENVTLVDANSINLNYVAGNITGAEAVSLLDFMVERVYESSPSPQSDLYACDVNGLAKLSCGDDRVSPRSDGAPIRSVTLVNLLVPDAPWSSSSSEGLFVYTSKDFDEMKAMGLNTVQISVPTSAFLSDDAAGAHANAVLTKVLRDLRASGLQAILSLVATGDELAPVVSAAEFSVSNDHADVVLGLTLPKDMKLDTAIVVDSVRAKVGPDLALFIPVKITDLASDTTGTLATDDPKVYGSLDWAHTSNVADIASSSSQEDRSKLFYHEAVACTMRSPIEHSLCFGNKLPIFWSSGFDLSIDDCANKNRSSFRDYGQCDRFEETVDSGWWQRHRASFAARQLFIAERGLGWSFAAWKTQTIISDGTMDDPSKLLSLREVAKGGLFPDLAIGMIGTSSATSVFPAQTACLNPPLNDFVLGDDTLSPTLAPPPDCGNGWYNFTTSQCKSNGFFWSCLSIYTHTHTLVTPERFA